MIYGDYFFNTLLKDFEEHGASAIDRLVKDNPAAFLKLCAAVIQEDLRIDLNAGDVAGEMNHKAAGMYGKRKDQA